MSDDVEIIKDFDNYEDIDELIDDFRIDEGVEFGQGCGAFLVCVFIIILALSQHPEIINKCFGG